jgi:hypothetical protein
MNSFVIHAFQSGAFMEKALIEKPVGNIDLTDVAAAGTREIFNFSITRFCAMIRHGQKTGSAGTRGAIFVST